MVLPMHSICTKQAMQQIKIWLFGHLPFWLSGARSPPMISSVHLFIKSGEYVAPSYRACLRMNGTFDATEWNSR
jgi:hypothetical protein